MTKELKAGILVLGAGGHGKSVVSVLLAAGTPVAGVLVDSPEKWGEQIMGVDILGPIEWLERYPDHAAVIAIGENAARESVALKFPEARWANVFYPQAYINPTARIGVGTVVFPGAIVGADVVLGNHVIVSGNTTVGHDAIIEDYAHLAPGVQIGGEVRVGRSAMLGIGSVVCPHVRVGEAAVLGAGAVAIKDIPAGCRAFGVPALVQQAKRQIA
ncbi:MAG: NeuD/PglB/VioB family sugar acetyltransferase [Acidobacteriota bacterium]